MDNLYHYVTPQFIPYSGTKAGKLLKCLLDGKPHLKHELMKRLGDDPRSPLQQLTGKTYGYWLIHNVAKKGELAIYQLDHRHLSGQTHDDLKARKLKRLGYAKASKNLAIHHSNRLPIALMEYRDALISANDEDQFELRLEVIDE